MEIKGKIIELHDTVQVTDSFQKREFIVEYVENPNFPEYLKFELIQDRCALLDPFKVDDEVTVQFNLKGRKWTDKQGETRYFNSLQAWRLEAAGGGGEEAPPADSAPDWIGNDDETDVLPF